MAVLLCSVDWFPDGSWILQMVGAGTNVYVFDICINVNNGTLAEGPSIMYSCLSLCAEIVF